MAKKQGFADQLHEEVERLSAYLDGEGDRREDYGELKEFLAQQVGLHDADEVYVVRARSNTSDNELWEGKALRRRFPLGVKLVPNDLRRKHDGYVEGMKHRMAPGEVGFDGIVLAAPGKGGKLTVTDVLEPPGGRLVEKLGSTFGKFEHHVIQEASPPTTPPPSERKEGGTDERVRALLEHLEETPNIILQGAPGTGKTYVVQAALREVAGTEEALEAGRLSNLLKEASGSLEALLKSAQLPELPLVWEIVQLHPGYSYEDLVRGLSVQADGAAVRFVPEDKIFVQMALVASKRPGRRTVLVLDEINRCNLPAALGELIVALEDSKRGKPVRLQYPAPPGGPSSDSLILSPELAVIGTMNTADRSIALVDYAIRRRFRFLDVLAHRAAIEEFYAKAPTRREGALRLFEAIDALVSDPRLKIGHAYFLAKGDTNADWAKKLARRFVYEVAPLLVEYAAEGRIARAPLMIGGKAILDFVPLTLHQRGEAVAAVSAVVL